MNLDWIGLLNTLGLTAIGGAGIGWVAKHLFTHVLSHDLEAYKAALKRDADEALAATKAAADAALLAQKAEFDRQLAGFQSAIADRQSHEIRVRNELERWANPILNAVRGLHTRLNNILEDDGYVALAKDGASNNEWSVSFDYFMPTTVYLFCQYFCWQRILQESIRFDLFNGQADKDGFLDAIRAIGRPLGTWPLDKLDGLPSGDRQVFSLQQRAAGEALIIEGGAEPVCMRLADFLAKWPDREFSAQFAPLVAFFDKLTPGTRRWRRLELVYDAMPLLEQHCISVLAPSSNTAS